MAGYAANILIKIIKKLNFADPRAMQVYVVVIKIRVKCFDRIVKRTKRKGRV